MSLLLATACGSDGGDKDSTADEDTSGDGDGDSAGDGDSTADGDGDAGEGDAGGDGDGPIECEPSEGNPECSLRDTSTYGKCIAENCHEQFANCAGEGFSSGEFTGPCAEFFGCIDGCCGDGACIGECGNPPVGCLACIIPAGICAAGAGCETPSCIPGGSDESGG